MDKILACTQTSRKIHGRESQLVGRRLNAGWLNEVCTYGGGTSFEVETMGGNGAHRGRNILWKKDRSRDLPRFHAKRECNQG